MKIKGRYQLIFEEKVWCRDLPLSASRVTAVFISFFILPSLLEKLSLSPGWCVLLPVLLALPWCIGSAGQLGIAKTGIKDLRLILASYLSIVALTVIVSPLWKLLLDFLGVEHVEQQALVSMIASSGTSDRIMIYIGSCLITPVVEEVVFRRIIYGWIVDTMPIRSAVLLTSLVFALLHFFIYGIPGLFIIGVVLQLVYLFSKNLLIPIITHALLNSVVLLITIFSN